MSALASFFALASFTVPYRIGVNPQSMVWLLPLAAAIAVVYKATKVSAVRPRSFLKEATVLFGSIVVFMVVTAVVLYALAWLVTE